MIAASAVGRSFATRSGPRPVLAGLDLAVAAGEMVVVVGRSGSGKTTLLNILAGFDRTFSGRVVVAGYELGDLGDRALSAYRATTVGVVLQGAAALAGASLLDNVVLPVHFLRGRCRPPLAAARRRARELLAEVGLADRADDRARTLSGGELQRLALARALMNAPPVLLCDEPTGNLDRSSALAVVELLDRLRRDFRLTVVAATHDELLATAAGRILQLVDGVLRPGTDGGATAAGEGA